MNEEEKFDELLSSKLSERDFPFDELSWDDAERLLVQQERKRRIGLFALIFSSGLIVGMLIMFPLMMNTHNMVTNRSVTASTAHQSLVTENNAMPSANQSNENIKNTTSKEDKAPLPVQSAFVKNDTRAGIRSNSSNSSNIPSDVKTAKEHKSLPISEVNNQKPVVKSNTSVSVKVVNKEPKHTVAGTQEKPSSNQVVANKSTAAPDNNIAENKTSSSNSDKTEKNNSNTSNTAIANSNNPSSIVANGNNTNKSSLPNNTTASTQTVNKPITKKDSNHPNPPLFHDAKKKYSPDDYSANIFSVYAGGTYSFGWNDNGDKEGNGITPWAGFNFTHSFTDGLSASLGIGYSELINLNKTYTSSIIGYDFGSSASTTTVTPQTVYYMAFPFKFQYSPDTKDILSVGGDYLLMMTTYSTLTTYKQTDFSQTAGTSEKQNGYTQGFSNSDIQLTFAYTRMITDRLGISVEYYHDLNYIENNSISGINQYAKNNGLRFVLSYQLIK